MIPIENIRKILIAAREQYGADSPMGHRCSNIVGLLGNRRGAAGEQLSEIDKELAKQVAELERFSAG
jgi:hypothetical protein